MGNLLFKLWNKLLKITNDKEAAIERPFWLVHVIAVMTAKDHSVMHNQQSVHQPRSLKKHCRTYPDLTALGSLP